MKRTTRHTFYSFNGHIPVVHPSAFVHPSATVVGNVVIGRDVYIGPSAVIRGDWGSITIKDGCNVQETCVIHVFPGASIVLHAGAHIGHGAVIHGATIGENVLIGMNAVVMDNALVGKESIVGALALIPSGRIIPPRSVVVGNPAKIVKKVSDAMLQWKTDGTRLYQRLPKEINNSMKPVEPLRSIPKRRKTQPAAYQTWHSTRKKK